MIKYLLRLIKGFWIDYKIYQLEQLMVPYLEKAKLGTITKDEAQQFNRLQGKRLKLSWQK